MPETIQSHSGTDPATEGSQEANITTSLRFAASTATPGLPFGTAEAERFLRLLGKDPAAPATRLRFFPHKKNANKVAIGAGRKVGGLDAVAIMRNHREQRGAYVVIGHGGDTKASITGCPALFVEWDDQEEAWQLNAWKVLGLPEPSVMVATGGASIHCYWLLHEAMDPVAWAPIQTRLITFCGADPACKDASRVMRLPGAWYIGPDGQYVAQTAIVHESEHRYDPADLVAAMDLAEARPFDITIPPPSMFGVHIPNDDDQPRREFPTRPMAEVGCALAWIPAILPDTKQRKTYRKLAWGLLCAVREAGGSDGEALALLEDHSPAVMDAAEYLKTEPHTVSADAFWKMARLAGWRPAKPDTTTPGTNPPTPGQAPPQPKQAAAQPRRSWEERNKRKLSHSRAMRCFDRCVEVQAQQERNSLTRRARLLKALHDLSLSKYVNRQEISQKVLEAKDRQQGRCFRAITAAERLAMDRPTVSLLIPGLVPEGDATIIGGRPKVGKTRVAYALAAARLNGKPVFGFEAPEPGPVIVISDDQGDADTGDMLHELGIWDHPQLIWSPHFRLTEADLDRVLAAIKANPGAMVIFDSLRSISRSLQYGENDPEIGAIIYDLKEAVVEAGGTPVLIHHCNKTEGAVGIEALSGHNAIPGAANTILTVAYLPDDKGRPQKDDPQRRLHREGRSGKPFDLVIAPAGAGTFERAAEFGDWQKQQKKAGSEKEALGKMPDVDIRVMAVLHRDREKWFTRREVCEARGVSWDDRGRGAEAQKVGRALRKLVDQNFAESKPLGREETFRLVGGAPDPLAEPEQASHGTQLDESMMTVMPTSDGKGSQLSSPVMTMMTTPPLTAGPEALSSLSSTGHDNETPVSDCLASLSSLIHDTTTTPLLTVSDRVAAAFAAGMTLPESILIWDRDRHGSPLLATEIKRALKKLTEAA
jgi:hypothetical protein